MTPDQQGQCRLLARLWDETPEELWQWWLDAEEDGSTWASFYRDMVEYAPRQGTSLRRLVLLRGKVNYHNTRNRLQRGWTLEEALGTPRQRYPASFVVRSDASGDASGDRTRKAKLNRWLVPPPR